MTCVGGWWGGHAKQGSVSFVVVGWVGGEMDVKQHKGSGESSPALGLGAPSNQSPETCGHTARGGGGGGRGCPPPPWWGGGGGGGGGGGTVISLLLVLLVGGWRKGGRRRHQTKIDETKHA